MVMLLLINLIIVSGMAYINESKFAVVTGTIQLENGSGSANVNYPSGFTRENSVVISSGCTYTHTGIIGFGFLQSSFGTGAILAANTIAFNAYSPENVGPSGEYAFKIVLMKIN